MAQGVSQQAIETAQKSLAEKLKITDPATQNALLGPVAETGKLRIMGIGSLCEYSHLETSKGKWKPELLERFPEIDTGKLFTFQSAVLTGYERDFVCMDNYYRGTADKPGITLGLNTAADGKAYGAILECDLNNIGLAPERHGEFLEFFFEQFYDREAPPNMPIYTFGVERPQIINGQAVAALICKADIDGPMYAGDLPRETRARIIATSAGPTLNPSTGAPKARGMITDLDYLRGVIESSKRFNIPVEQELLDTYTMAVAFRQALPQHERERLELYEKSGPGANTVPLLATFLTAAIHDRQEVLKKLGMDQSAAGQDLALAQ